VLQDQRALHDARQERLAAALDVSVDYLLVLRDTPQRDATGTALYESTQDELVALRLLRMVIDELPPEDRVRLIHYLIKQAGIYKETFQATRDRD
jgi:hypothetical protein